MTNLNIVKVYYKGVSFNEFKFSNKEDMDKFLETDTITSLNDDYSIIVKKEILKENVCNWLLEDYNHDLWKSEWKSECGMDWRMTNSEGFNSQMNFCPNCGGEITVVN